MKLIYTPENGARAEWTFKLGRLLNVEAEEIEKRTGMTFTAWKAAVQSGSMLAMHALLFVLLRRDQPRLAWDQVQFADEDVELEYDLDETIALRDSLKAQLEGDTLDPDAVAGVRNLVAALDEEIAEQQPAAAAHAEDAAGVEAPKAEPPSETSGGLHSLPTSTSTLATSTG